MPSFLCLAGLVAMIAFLVQWLRMSRGKVPVKGDVLLVFAHPDDEAMFFTPLLFYLRKHQIAVHLLCLSNGNADGLGSVREKELYESGRFFGIPASNMKVVNHAELQDGMKNVWPKSVIKHIVNEYLDRIGSIRTIVTFDKHGVSSHPNHIAVHNGVKEVKESMPPGLLFVELITRSIVGKYCGCLSLTNYCLFANTTEYNGSRFSLSIPPYATLSSFRAMERHQSQLRWFRYLFVLFSSYTYINEFQPIS